MTDQMREKMQDRLFEAYPNEDKRFAYVRGMNWYRNNTWHDINEKPEEHRELLIYKVRDCGNSFYTALYSSANDTVFINGQWHKLSTMTKWAYVEDLIADNMNM